MSIDQRADPRGANARVLVCDGPAVELAGSTIVVPEGARRLVALVALLGPSVDRRFAAGTLWPESTESQAGGNLRTAMWRLRRHGIAVLETTGTRVRLHRDVVVDIVQLDGWADRVIAGAEAQADRRLPTLAPQALDLLPGWYDDWVVRQRDVRRQRLLHAIEALSATLVRTGQCADAVDVAMCAVRAEPFRESAHRALAAALLGDGNLVEAVRVYRDFRRALRRELGAEPTAAFRALLSAHVPLDRLSSALLGP